MIDQRYSLLAYELLCIIGKTIFAYGLRRLFENAYEC